MRVSREVACDPGAVYRVLADGWTYGSWVVGNSRIRRVDACWPERGTKILHSAGVWPLRINDVTVVTDVEPGRYLRLRAELWLLGTADIRIALEPVGHARTRVTMEEVLIAGPAKLVPGVLAGLLLWPRNAESLRRLGDLAVGRESQSCD
ncbi:SRPBCC family protein [Prauserella muralis]|uniref:Polyketide cyclase n=1 Tax=Prauserella muralis TaxID=588067 RepID=A0A2V4BFC9_9PSEU|nr:SRPBCC family protein [Prauserella muralis]PXY28299.1 polyketide cyclase [Prauserella muralis]TWE23487.1 hypothetical protein FHX69_4752 [Prauserella muralis]